MKYAQNSHHSLTILDLIALKQVGEKISCLTAYDASFSALIDRLGVEVILIGDSLGMVIQGQNTTVPVTLDEIIYHSRCVIRGRKHAFVMADLPFSSYYSKITAVENAMKLMQQGGVQMVKLEGAKLDIIRFLVEQGIPVCGHLGLLPQSINQLGAYKVKGKQPEEANRIFEDAQKIEQAGADLLILECVPAVLAKEISLALTIPVIGIGAGVDCDGQILVLYDMIGLGEGKRPRFTQNFMDGTNTIEEAIQCYHHAVKHTLFPTLEQSY
ncbi:MAG: 3-methyl-2-oxobutanoate hydroxymethyltransferase [Methylococcales bacterium]|nr:3-methyl-2-oxobutanoate hydroxymethyltransferase [Methylococcales bacterium]